MIRILCLLFVVFCALPRAAEAVEILPGKPGICLATLKGTIEAGDLQKLRAVPLERPASWANFEDGRWKALCLDSPGGSLSSGLELAGYFLENGVGTVVGDGADCLSACALLFMFGTAYQHESASITHRRMHVGGRLGFHQPDLTLDRTRSYSVEDVEAAFDLAIRATLAFLANAARPRPDTPRPFVDADLLEAMLQHEGQNFFEIDTVNKAGRWGIELFGYTAPQVDSKGMFYACQNMTGWAAQLEQNQSRFEGSGSDATIDVSDRQADFVDGRRYRVSFHGMMTYDCEGGLIRDWTGQTTLALCGVREELSTQIGPFECVYGNVPAGSMRPVPGFAMLPAQTRLAGLRSGGRAAPVRVFQGNPCVSSTGQARVFNVQNFTSLRAGVGHDTDRVDQVPLGTALGISGRPVFDTRHASHAYCLSQCQAAGAGRGFDAEGMSACVDANWLWYSAVTPQGLRGYVSAKFIEYR